MSTEFIDGTAGKIAVHHLTDAGATQPSDRTLVVCHATGFLGRVYRAMAHELRHDATVIALDFRAHGDSDAPSAADGMNWSGMADDLEAVLAHVGANELHGFGHSMGGAALLEVERRTPGTFNTAFVFEPIVPPPGAINPDGSPIVRGALGRTRTFASRSETLQRYASRPPLGLFRADVLHDYVTHGFADTDTGEVTLKCAPENEAATFLNAGQIHLGLMTEIELDVVVGVSSDGQLPAQLAPVVAEKLPNGVLMEFLTLTHFGPLQDPVLVANAVRQLMLD